MNLNRQFVGHKKRLTKYKEASKGMDLVCSFCGSHSQSVVSMTEWELGVNCDTCGHIWQKELEEDIDHVQLDN